MTDPNLQPDGQGQVPPPPAGQVPPPPPGYQQPGYPPQQPGAYPPQGYPPQGYPQQQAQPGAPLTAAEDKQWAMFSHFGGLLGPLPALIIFLVFKDRGPFTKQEAKEALNWQITFIAAMIVLGIISGVITGIAFSSLSFGTLALVSGIFGFLYFAVWAVNAIFSIMG
ncbi:MAG: DUF4870 domain-containing protein, partial [Microbacteriaceae bacterium]